MQKQYKIPRTEAQIVRDTMEAVKKEIELKQRNRKTI